MCISCRPLSNAEASFNSSPLLRVVVYARFEVSTALMARIVIWVVMLCSGVNTSRT